MTRRVITAVAAVALAACNGSATHERPIASAGVIVLGQGHALRRPPVRFDHVEHAKALREEGCKACHQTGSDGRLVPRFARKLDARMTWEQRRHLYHDRCIGCHTDRKQQGMPTGAVTCGECHAEGPVPVIARARMRFDYSLHARHVAAEGGESSCGQCHHVYDRAARKLVPARGKEEGCVACHGERDDGKRLSRRNASHVSCVGCHLKAASGGKKSGPTLCEGCHDAAWQKRIARLKDPPPMERDRPAVASIQAAGAKTGPVAFNHRDHEPLASFCSTCHHRGLRSCASCHTLQGDRGKGGGVTLADAHHHPSSRHSCIGCHARATADRECAGCHSQLTGERPGPAACQVCHRSGPAAAAASQPTAPPELSPLPATGEGYPETVTIGLLAREYEPSVLPHAKIVDRLDRAVRGSKLARSFHGTTGTLCSGCHHHSPAGARPPPCRSCHGSEAMAGEDRPRLYAAYHRQCIGCHQKMGIKDDCTSCHVRARKQAEGPR